MVMFMLFGPCLAHLEVFFKKSTTSTSSVFAPSQPEAVNRPRLKCKIDLYNLMWPT